MMAQPDHQSVYIHGTDPQEQERLSRLNDFLNDGALRELNLSRERRILDVGSGLGQLTRCMARALAQKAVVIGIERDERQLAQARRLAHEAGEGSLCDFRQGSAESLPLTGSEWGSFDLTHTRFVLEHVAEPELVVQQMVQATRPGGRIVLEDDDHEILRLHPEPSGFWPLWHAYMRSYDRVGNDPYMGRRLVSLLRQCGAEPVRNTWLFFGACSGNENFGLLVTNLLHVLAGARETVLAERLFDQAAFDRALDELKRWGMRDDAAIWFSVCWAEGRRPVTR